MRHLVTVDRPAEGRLGRLSGLGVITFPGIRLAPLVLSDWGSQLLRPGLVCEDPTQTPPGKPPCPCHEDDSVGAVHPPKYQPGSSPHVILNTPFYT